MSDSSDASGLDSVDQPKSALGPRNFLLSLVVAAVFPFFLAIGFATRTAVPPPAKLEAAVQPAPSVPNQIVHSDSERQLADHDRSKGDALIRDGRFETALHFYRSLGNANSLRMPPELVFRIAICQEALGLWDDALAGFRSIASVPNPVLSAAANLGQARVWLRLNDFEKAEPLLRCLLLQAIDFDLKPTEFISQAEALFALTLAEISMPPAFGESQGMQYAFTNLFDLSFENAIDLADSKVQPTPAESESGGGPQSGGATPALADNPSNQVDNVQRWFPEHLEPSTGLRRRLPPLTLVDTSLATVVEHIAKECGLKVQWKESNRQRADRRLNLRTAELPASLLLTILCREMDMIWTMGNYGATIVFADNPVDSPQLELVRIMADTNLLNTIDSIQDARMKVPLKFASAQIAEIQDRRADAAQSYSSLVGKQTSQIAIYAAYHAALNYHQLRDLTNACKMLEVIVHGAPGHELHSHALILLGRLLIDQGEFHEAAFQLKRAAESRNSTEEQARAAMFCAMAMLLEDRPHDAGDILFRHRLQFHDQQLRSAAALWVSLARYRTIPGCNTADRNREGQYLYRSIVAVASDSDWLGPSGQLLLGQAMLEAGLIDEMAELYMQAINRGVPRRVADEMNLQLAEYRYDHKHFAEAKSLLSRLFATTGPCRIKAGLRLAELVLEAKDAETCLKICHQLKDESTILKRDLLMLAGRAYELAGQQNLAARCYAGQWPLP